MSVVPRLLTFPALPCLSLEIKKYYKGFPEIVILVQFQTYKQMEVCLFLFFFFPSFFVWEDLGLNRYVETCYLVSEGATSVCVFFFLNTVRTLESIRVLFFF